MTLRNVKSRGQARLQATEVAYEAGTSDFGGEGPVDAAEALNQYRAFQQGTFVESFDALATSDGATVTMSLEQAGTGDLLMVFSDGYTTFTCTPTAATTPLQAGTDEIYVENYVYILQSDKILTVSTSDWPAAEHIRVGHFVVPSANFVNTRGGVYGNQNHNDHAKETAGASVEQGHMTDLSALGRLGGATWLSGCAGTATESGNELYISMTAGVVQQVHKHTFAALDSNPGSTGDPILVVNDFDTKYLVIDSLNDIEKLSDGTLIGNNKYVKFVLIGVASKEGELQLMLVNVPSGQYNSVANATRDVDGHANFTIPAAFGLNASTGFLSAAFVCKHTATAMEIEDTIELRGATPATAPGSGTGGGDVSAAAAMADNAVIRGDGGAKDIQDSGVLIDDSDEVSGVASLTVTDSASIPPLNITERSAEPSAPAANDVYLDDGTNTASGNPGWRRYTGSAWEDIGAVPAKYREYLIPFTLEDPIDDTAYKIGGAANAMTIIRATYRSMSGSMPFNIEKRDPTTPETTGTEVWTVDKTFTTSSASSPVTSFDSAGVDQYDLLFIETKTGTSPGTCYLDLIVRIDA